jgi:WD40 repeat protein/energy-coupling factor transporter ATP-binding protein EcfA2
MNNDAEANVNIGGDVQGVSAHSMSDVTITQNFISAHETEESIHRRQLIQVSPYLGLSKFQTDDKDKFFGREEWIIKLGDRLLKKDNVLLLLGASGSGKSSLIRAGLIPHLRDNWGSFINLTFRPDKNPFESFYYCLAPHYTQSQAEIDRTVAENTFIKVSQSLKQDSRWLIFVDQFEELFTTTPKLERDKFVASLVQLINQQDSSVKIVLTMRADFLDKFSSYSELGHIHDRYSYILTNMSEKELQLAIAEPAARNGVTFEKGLVDQIIKDFDEQSGSLPLLEYTLDLLWSEEKRKDNLKERVLKTKTYEELGGVSGALNQQANKIYHKQLNEQEREAAKEIFLELISIVEKQPVSRRTDKSLFLETRDKESVLNKLIENRLLVSTGEKQIATVEVAHEQLLRSWQVLKDLIKDKEDIIVFRSRLTTDANQWNEIRKQDEQKANDELWSGLKLEQVLKYRKDPKFHQILFAKPESLENQFIQASVARRDFLRQQEDKRKQRELETARKIAQEAEARRKAEEVARLEAEQRAKEAEGRQQAQEEARQQAEQRAEQEIKARKAAQTRNRVAALSIVSLIGLTSVAFYQWRESLKNTMNALAKTSEASLLSGRQLEALVSAVQSGKQSQNPILFLDTAASQTASAALQRAVYNVQERNRLEGYEDKVSNVVFSPDGKTLASTSNLGNVKLWDLATGKEIKTLNSYISTLNQYSSIFGSIVFSPDGKTLTSADIRKTVRLWDLATGTEIKTLAKLKENKSLVLTSTFLSPDGKTLAFVNLDERKTVKLWDLATGKVNTLDGHRDIVNRVVFSPDGKTLASGSQDGIVKLWDVATGKIINTPDGHTTSAVGSLVFSPDGKTLASGSADNSVKLWNVKTGKLIKTLDGHTSMVTSLVFRPDGKTLASGSWDGTIKLWNVATGTEIKTLQGHSSVVWSVVFSPDGKTLASGSDDHSVRLWDVANVPVTKTLNRDCLDLVFSPDGKILASSGYSSSNTSNSCVDDNSITLLDVATGTEIKTLQGHSSEVSNVVFSPDGKTLASGSRDGSIKLWNVATGTEINTLQGHSSKVWSVVFSPDGKTLASASDDKTVKLWDVATGTEIKTLQGHSSKVWSVVFSPDGKTLAAASADKTVKLWDVATGTEIKTLQGHSSSVESVVFSPDGKTLASASLDNSVILWNLYPNNNLNDLMTRSCDWLRGYLQTNPNVSDSDRTLCNGINPQN